MLEPCRRVFARATTMAASNLRWTSQRLQRQLCQDESLNRILQSEQRKREELYEKIELFEYPIATGGLEDDE